MRFLFLMDPMESLTLAKDTTFAWMLAAAAAGHVCEHARPLDLSVDGGELFVQSAEVAAHRSASADGYDDRYTQGERRKQAVADFDAVLIRKDPPFDAIYAYMTQLLELVRGRTLVLNDPRGLRDANEKLYALSFAKWMPKTLVTASQSQIRDFTKEVGGISVIKPLDGMAGAGIFILRSEDLNFSAIVEATIGENGNRYCMVQEYVPAVREGDKRILLLDGEPLGAILRVPKSDEARANIHVGGTVQKTVVTEHEREMIADMKPTLIAAGLHFVGLDVIGGRLTEVNVTSPTGIQQMQKLDGVDYSKRVIDWIAAHAKARKLG
jgi:glutathione synthase